MADAYKWLQTLPANVREEMKSMEQVVSLFLRAKRLGGALPTKEDIQNFAPKVPEQSKSSQEFQHTLKHLKHELEQFDFDSNQAHSSGPNSAGSTSISVGLPSSLAGHTGRSQNQPQVPLEVDLTNQAATSQGGVQTPTTVPHQPNLISALRLDPKSRQIVNEIRESLNLSSDVEVLRMSLVLAHKALKDILS